MTDKITIEYLKSLPQWVGYKDKIPMNPKNGRRASSNDPNTWTVASRAWQGKNRHGWDGIGFVFTIDSGIIGIDLDDCLHDGGLTDEAAQIVACLDSYTEISPSGNGIHILVQGDILHSIKKQTFEMYNELRYFTITGNRYSENENIEARQKELDALFVVFGGDFNDKPLPDAKPITPQTTSESDIKAALDSLPSSGDYNTFWLPVIMAVHSALPNERGIGLIESWSPGKRGEVRRKFRSFDRTANNGVTISTLFGIAKEYGYKTPSRPKYNGIKKGIYDLRDRL